MERNSDYYKCSREEMLEFIPLSCKKVLDIGCGEGSFASAIKKIYSAEVWGIELDDAAGKKAQTQIDRVMIGDINKLLPELPDSYFDCIIFNDSLEHLLDPYKLIDDIKIKMVDDAVIISSIPNVRYIKNLYELLIKKEWKYRDEGILDFTHLRFFTKKSIFEMFTSKGYEIIKIEGINPTKKNIIFNLLNILLFGFISDTKYLQFACIAKLRTRTKD